MSKHPSFRIHTILPQLYRPGCRKQSFECMLVFSDTCFSLYDEKYATTQCCFCLSTSYSHFTSDTQAHGQLLSRGRGTPQPPPSPRMVCIHYPSNNDALVSLHWLRVPERIQFKIAVLTYRVHHGDAPQYLGPFTSTADVPGRRALRSAGTKRLVVPPVRLSTVGSRAFPVAAAQIWNSLPEHIVSAPTLQSFRRHFKSFYCNNLSVYRTLVHLVVISVT